VPIDNATTKDVPDPATPNAVSILVNSILGLSPRVAGLALNRAGEKGKEGLAAELNTMLRESDGTVGYIKEQDGYLLLCPFSMADDKEDSLEKFSTFSEAAWQWKNTAGSRKNGSDEDPHDAISRDLNRVQDRIKRELDILYKEEKRCLEHETIRQQAETLLINAEDVWPGSEKVTLPHPLEEGESVFVNLDPSKSARENADHLFRLARRLRRGLAELEKRKSFLADSRKEMEQVKSELATGNEKGARKFLQTASIGLLEEPSNEKGPRYPGRRYQRGEFTILVGKSAMDNEKVTFEAAGPHDLWLHTRDYPGSHVVILTGKKNPPQEIINEAAQLAIASSGAKGDPSAEVMITERKWVQRIKGGKPGQVKVARYRSVRSRR
jgi:predicted ribosome quality control (RQC) complex YloA/Tae2 family protein